MSNTTDFEAKITSDPTLSDQTEGYIQREEKHFLADPTNGNLVIVAAMGTLPDICLELDKRLVDIASVHPEYKRRTRIHGTIGTKLPLSTALKLVESGVADPRHILKSAAEIIATTPMGDYPTLNSAIREMITKEWFIPVVNVPCIEAPNGNRRFITIPNQPTVTLNTISRDQIGATGPQLYIDETAEEANKTKNYPDSHIHACDHPGNFNLAILMNERYATSPLYFIGILHEFIHATEHPESEQLPALFGIEAAKMLLDAGWPSSDSEIELELLNNIGIYHFATFGSSNPQT